MISLDNMLVLTRGTYTRKVSDLLKAIGDENDVDTGVQVGELSEEFTAWRDQWDYAWELNGRDNDAFELFVDVFGMEWETSTQLQETITAYESAYIGAKTVKEYVEEYVEDTGMFSECPEGLRLYIDYESMGRDMLLGGDITEHEGHLFRSNW